MSGKELQRALVMHPLPRVDELAYDMDADPRQHVLQTGRPGGAGAHGINCAGARRKKEYETGRSPGYKVDYPVYNREYGVKCSESAVRDLAGDGKNYLKPEFKIVSLKPLTFRCVYCEHGTERNTSPSTEWHQGNDGREALQPGPTAIWRRKSAGNLIAFDQRKRPKNHGYLPGHYAQSQSC